MHAYNSEIRHLVRDGKEILRYTHKIYQPQGLDKICSFYREIAANCLAYCEGPLIGQLCEMPCEAGQKYCYSLTAEPVLFAEGRLCIKLEVLLYKNRANIEKSFVSQQIWDTAEQILIQK